MRERKGLTARAVLDFQGAGPVTKQLLTAVITIALGAGRLGAALLDAQATRQPVDVAKLGPQVGERVPDFNLEDQHGNTQTLRSIMGPKGAMLVFFRSADW